jgi:LmbE family N-acetylglucosaminyl deacetylase
MTAHRKEKVLLLGPHPDDVFIACGGFILKNVQSYDIEVCCIVSKGMLPSDEIRKKEEESAWKEVSGNHSVDLTFFPGVDTKLYESHNQIISFIESKVKSQYKYIFTPYRNDTHQDHRTVSEATLSACRYSKNVIFYETPSTYDFSPTMFVELSDEIMNKKIKASANYGSQILGTESFSMNLSSIIESKAIANGSKTRVCKYAEGFKPFRVFL